METFVLKEWQSNKTRRPWGYYCVLHEAAGVKVKELTVDPGAALSMQRHEHRAEFWLVSAGHATVYTLEDEQPTLQGQYHRHQYLHIAERKWHQLVNAHSDPLKIIEIQYGSQCVEHDIERCVI